MGCSSCAGLPAGVPCPGGCGRFTLVDKVVGQTLVDRLTPTVDRIRDIYTRLGARQYTVTLIWTRWAGGVRGAGEEFVIKECMIQPTPDIGDLTELANEVQMIGPEETGTLEIKEISPRFNEDLLMGRGGVVREGDPIPDDVSFYWEVMFPRPDASVARRRFVPASAPNKDPTGFDWQIKLAKASEDRARDGEPR